MTHTPDGSSGVGDHGQAGIDAFKKQHQCQETCLALRLNESGLFAETRKLSEPGNTSETVTSPSQSDVESEHDVGA